VSASEGPESVVQSNCSYESWPDTNARLLTTELTAIGVKPTSIG